MWTHPLGPTDTGKGIEEITEDVRHRGPGEDNHPDFFEVRNATRQQKSEKAEDWIEEPVQQPVQQVQKPIPRTNQRKVDKPEHHQQTCS